MIALHGISVSFDGVDVLRDVSLDVQRGEVVALLGPSGSGKSTLLRVIAGIVLPDAGTVHLDGVDVTRLPIHRRRVGMVFQDNQLFPHRSVLDNVAFGLKMAGVAREERRARADEWLVRVGLAGIGDRRVTELSGGEAKRVALARTLIVEPAVVLLDEPLTGLDRDRHDELVVDLAALLADADITAILVTHDPDEAGAIADRVAELHDLSGGDHRVVVVESAATHDLRRRVLRHGDPDAGVDWPDDRASTHLAAVDDADQVVAVSTWIERDDGVQLRGMATEPGLAGSGLGSLLLLAGIERARASGATHVWANARLTALGFYERHGFSLVGGEFVDATTGLPHRVVRFDLD